MTPPNGDNLGGGLAVCCFRRRRWLAVVSCCRVTVVMVLMAGGGGYASRCRCCDPISKDAMSKEIISIGSETRPPVLVVGEYQQWKRRMINFLDLLDDKLMVSITEGPKEI
ncbi:hypothetical protein OSB04_002349 [Centaurea solstitialis]|uniref:Uncharacterized protein n=1 Tax=Centaurea solstitialis TaxID=347529 RepID=A0AA38TSQ2_9ASTR|nr:hypothetical protein OSB04_002349 [Centaurea solstitialis]